MIAEPGATKSVSTPQFEKPDPVSALVEEETAIADEMQAGYETPRLSPINS